VTDQPHDRDRFNLDFTRLHGIIKPADVRVNDRIEARVRPENESVYFPMKVWRTSPIGAELVIENAMPALEKGSTLELELLIAGQRIHFDAGVVEIIQENEHIRLAGVRFHQHEVVRDGQKERRGQTRWTCWPDYTPTATSPTPGQINDHMQFKIRDISRRGMQLTCSLRNKLLIPGMSLQLTVNFGVDGVFHTPVTIRRVGFTSEGGRDRLSVGVDFDSFTPRMRSIIGQYLIQFAEHTSLARLNDEGLWPISVTNAVNFSYLTTDEEYQRVKALRKEAHEADANLNQDVTMDDMGDRFDSHARIIIGTHHDGKLVCTARVLFNTDDEPFEHSELVELPADLPRKTEIVEISRLAIHPDYRHGDLLVGLFEFITTTCVHERKYVLISCLERMIPFFKHVGFEPLGLSYSSPLFNDKGHVLFGDIYRIILGWNVNPIYWNLVYRRVTEFLVEANRVQVRGIDRARLATYRMFGPVAKAIAAYRDLRLRRNRSA
jgi:predicted GNAT family N-acyltransferase